MENKYDIDSLIETFERHHKEVLDKRKRNLDQYPDNEYYEKIDDFCISKAFMEICKEIKKLKGE